MRGTENRCFSVRHVVLIARSTSSMEEFMSFVIRDAERMRPLENGVRVLAELIERYRARLQVCTHDPW
jgi:hypothetical protein